MDLGPAKQQTVLAVLLMEPGRLVTSQSLIERVWDQRPKADGKNALYTYVARLRRVLRDASARSAEPIGLLRQSGGYRLQVGPERVDVHRFRQLAARNRLAIGAADEERAEWLREAAALWGGTPLAGLPGQWVARTRDLLRRQYIEMLVRLADVEARLGNSDAMVWSLREALAEHPFSDALLGRLLTILDQAGLHTEALEAYTAARERRLVLGGSEPGNGVQRILKSIGQLTSDPARLPPALTTREPQPAEEFPEPTDDAVPPNLLPPDFVDFVGREDELARLSAGLEVAGGSAPNVMVLSGKGGVGKSALAVHAAHGLNRSFPDGVLYLDLQGTGERPVPVEEALERLLRAVHAPRLPGSTSERSELLRSLLAGRRVLVVLDDARDEDQVEPLLPGAAPSAVLVTSRALLAGLHADRLPVRPFSEDMSIQMLVRAVGVVRIAAETMPARDLVRLCDGLPLALRIAATRLIGRPHWTVAQLVARLAPPERRLDELAHRERSVRSSLTASVATLDDATLAAWHRLARAELISFTAAQAGALLRAEPQVVEDVLDHLLEVHALVVDADRHYRIPPLERLLAAERVPDVDPWIRRRTGTGDA